METADITMKMLRTFLAVASEGSFMGAGARQALTQPTVSIRIATLEKAVGARLFERSVRGRVRLTRTGQGLLPRAQAVVAAHDRMTAWLAGPRGRRLW